MAPFCLTDGGFDADSDGHGAGNLYLIYKDADGAGKTLMQSLPTFYTGSGWALAVLAAAKHLCKRAGITVGWVSLANELRVIADAIESGDSRWKMFLADWVMDHIEDEMRDIIYRLHDRAMLRLTERTNED